MKKHLRNDAEMIALRAIEAVKPDAAVCRALENIVLTGNVYLVSVGKAAWQMAAAAVQYLKAPIYKGIVVTKYDHVMGEIPGVICYEAGHPVPDENSFRGTRAVLELVSGLTAEDTVVFLLSGGNIGMDQFKKFEEVTL